LYEVVFAKWALKHGLELASHIGMLRWQDDNGKSHRYFPDFWVKSWNCYVEIKSSWTNKLHPEKLDRVRVANPDVELRLLVEAQLSELGIDMSRNEMYRLRILLKNNPSYFAE
jgi:hypothetical protein